jgi:hypothetical protein
MKTPPGHNSDNNNTPPSWLDTHSQKSFLKKQLPPPSAALEEVEAEQDEDDRKPPAGVRSTNDSQTEQSFCSTNDTSQTTTVAYHSHGSSPHTSAVAVGTTSAAAAAVGHMATIDEDSRSCYPPTPSSSSYSYSSLAQMTGTAIFLGGTSVTSALAFIVIMLPTEALVALCIALLATILFVIQLYRCAVQAYVNAVNGRGIGDYLPSWLFSALVEESIHQRMVDPTFELEWRHLALYFFPGLSRAQLESYIDRLPYRHRHFLLRPGVGHVLGNEFMQLILGRERYPEVPANNVVLPATVVLDDEPQNHGVLPPPPPTADGNESVWSDHDAPVIARELAGARRLPFQSPRPPRHVLTTRTAPTAYAITAPVAPPSEETNDSLDYESEFSILYEAFTVGMTSMVITPVLSAGRYMTNRFTTFLTRPNVALTIIGGTMGVFGYSRGLWGRHGIRNNLTLRDRDVWTTAVLGGGMASFLLLVRSTTHRNRTRRNSRRGDNSSSMHKK